MDGHEQREREKGQEGVAAGVRGVLDESQGIPELATYTRGPQMPFLSHLCRQRQVPFEVKRVYSSPSAPPPALLHHRRYLGRKEEPERNPRTLKEDAVGI